MSISTKDYIILSQGLLDAKPAPGPGITATQYDAMVAQWMWTISTIANRMRATNPRFDRDRFVKACVGL